MGKKYVKLILPTPDKIKKAKGLSRIGSWLERRPHLFSLRSKKVALGFSVGIALGMIPLPVQIPLSIAACLILKTNVPAALASAAVVNPITYPLFFALILQIGSMASGTNISDIRFPSGELLFSHPEAWTGSMSVAVEKFGNVLSFGIPATAAFLGSVSYWLIRAGWYASVIFRWKRRPWRNGRAVVSEAA